MDQTATRWVIAPFSPCIRSFRQAKSPAVVEIVVPRASARRTAVAMETARKDKAFYEAGSDQMTAWSLAMLSAGQSF
jgi:hypothetical protein